MYRNSLGVRDNSRFMINMCTRYFIRSSFRHLVYTPVSMLVLGLQRLFRQVYILLDSVICYISIDPFYLQTMPSTFN